MQKFSLALFACWAAVIAVAARADVYKWTDANGRVHYGDMPMDSKNSKSAKVLITTPATKTPPVDKPQFGSRDGSNRQLPRASSLSELESAEEPAAPPRRAADPPASAPRYDRLEKNDPPPEQRARIFMIR